MLTRSQLVSNRGSEEVCDGATIHHAVLLFRNKPLTEQTVQLLFHTANVAAGLVADVLEHRMDSVSVGRTALTAFYKLRLSPCAVDMLRLLCLLCRFLVLHTAFSLGGGLLGRCTGRSCVLIPEAQTLADLGNRIIGNRRSILLRFLR